MKWVSRPGEVGGAPPARLAGATVTHFPPLSNSQCTRSPTTLLHRPECGVVEARVCRTFSGGARWENIARNAGRRRAARVDARERAASGAVPPVGVHRPHGSHPAIPSGHVSPVTPTRRMGLAVLAALVVAVAAGCGARRRRPQIRRGSSPHARPCTWRRRSLRRARRATTRWPPPARCSGPPTPARGCRSSSAGRAARATSRPGSATASGPSPSPARPATARTSRRPPTWTPRATGCPVRAAGRSATRTSTSASAPAAPRTRWSRTASSSAARPPCARRSTPPEATTSPRSPRSRSRWPASRAATASGAATSRSGRCSRAGRRPRPAGWRGRWRRAWPPGRCPRRSACGSTPTARPCAPMSPASAAPTSARARTPRWSPGSPARRGWRWVSGRSASG